MEDSPVPVRFNEFTCSLARNDSAEFALAERVARAPARQWSLDIFLCVFQSPEG